MKVTVYFRGGYVVEGNFSAGEDVELHREGQIDDMATAMQIALEVLASGRSASARETLARMPVINDPVISEAMAALEEQNDG